MSQTVKINGISYANVPRVKIPLNSDTSQFAEFYDISNATATAADMLAGKTAYGPNGATGETNKGLITGTIATKTSSDLTVNGKTVTAPAGYYASAASKSVADGSATTPTTTITPTTIITAPTTGTNAGKIVATVSGSSSITPTVSAGYVSTGTSGTVSVSGSTTINPATLDTNLKSANIKAGTTIFGIAGSSTVVDTSDATATASDMLSGKTAYVNGSKVTGNIVGKSSADLTVNGGTVTAPAGYYGSAASASVASMTLPTAPTGTSSGTAQGSAIGRSTSTRYLNIPVGYNDTAKYYTISAVANGSATTPATIITPTVTPTLITSGANAGKIQIAVSGNSSITPTVSAGYVSAGTAGTVSVSSTTTVSASTLDENLISDNIKSGVTIFGVSGSSTVVDTAIGTTASATSNDILSGKSAYVNGQLVEGAIASKSSSDLTVSGATVTVPAGYYGSGASATVASGSATTPTTSIAITPTFGVSTTTGIVTVTGSSSKSITPTVSAGYVTAGTSGTVSTSISTTSSANQYQLPVQGASTWTPTTSDQTIAAGKWLTGAQTIKGDANLVAGNIKQGTTIFGVSGTLSLVSVVQDSTTKVLTIS